MMTTVSDSTLAINGARPVRQQPWPKRGLFGEEEKQAAMRVFDRSIASGEAFGYNGEEETGYCNEFAKFMGGGFADLVNSGTTAVYVALKALDLEPFTEVIVPPITDPGGVMPIPLINCIPVPADTAPNSYNTGAEQIEARITPQTSAILVAHISGLPCDMNPIMELARARRLPVIEDCAQAHGALYKGKMIGTFGDVAAFSTMFGKHHATGGQGGVVFAKNEEMYWRIRRASDRGKPFGLQGTASNVFASLNLNNDELSAAIGRVQLTKLPSILERRRAFAQAIIDGCEKLKAVRVLGAPAGCEGAYWFLFFSLDIGKLKTDKQTFVKALVAEGLPVESGYLHIAEEADWYRNRAVFGHSGYPWACPLYKGDLNRRYELPNARATDSRHFRFSMHENYGPQEVRDTLAALAKVEAAYLKST